MALKFKQISWQTKDVPRTLMYVEFEEDGQILRWYPKWKEVAGLFDAAVSTETDMNNQKLTPYLLLTAVDLLTRHFAFNVSDKSFDDLEATHKYHEAIEAFKNFLLY